MNRTLIWQIALRYFAGKRKANVVPILSRISMVAIAVSSAAMVIVFSVFNGLEGVVKDLYKGFYPDIKISAAKGKFFAPDAALIQKVKSVSGIAGMTTVIEDNAIAHNAFSGAQKVITLKGIDRNYLNVNNIRDSIVGEDTVSTGKPYTAIAGRNILAELGVDIDNVFNTILLYYPNPDGNISATDITSAYRSLEVHPAGAFHISDDQDDKYMLAPLSLVQSLLHAEGKCSSLELLITPGKEEEVQQKLQAALGESYKVETRYEQNKSMYMVLRSEKWAIYAILTMVLLIASFNMIGALSMLVMEKQKDIGIMKAMGAQPADIRMIFVLEGVMWALAGGLSGITLGAVIVALQQRFGIVTVGGSFLMDSYPVDIQLTDTILVVLTVTVVGILAAWYPAGRATRTPAPTLKSA